MYELFLFVHSWLRWLITIFLLLTFINALKNYMQNSIYTKKDRILGGILVGFVHLQLLMGFILYFALSPLTHVAMLDMGYAMKNPVLRYWSVEHLAGMVVFAVFVQIAQSSSKRARGDLKKHKRMAIFTGIAIVVLAITMPWPYRKNVGRPLFLTYPQKFIQQPK